MSDFACCSYLALSETKKNFALLILGSNLSFLVAIVAGQCRCLGECCCNSVIEVDLQEGKSLLAWQMLETMGECHCRRLSPCFVYGLCLLLVLLEEFLSLVSRRSLCVVLGISSASPIIQLLQQ